MTIHMNLDQFPFVRVTLHGYVTEAELKTHLENVSASVLARKERFVILNDATAMMGLPTAKARQIIGDWTKANEGELVRYACGAVLVTDSPLVRGLLTAIQWIAPSRVERVTRPTLAEAEAWARERLYGGAARRDSLRVRG